MHLEDTVVQGAFSSENHPEISWFIYRTPPFAGWSANHAVSVPEATFERKNVSSVRGPAAGIKPLNLSNASPKIVRILHHFSTWTLRIFFARASISIASETVPIKTEWRFYRTEYLPRSAFMNRDFDPFVCISRFNAAFKVAHGVAPLAIQSRC